MSLKDIYAVAYTITLFLLFFYALFLLTVKKKRTVSHTLLAVFLSALALSYLNNVVMTFKDYYFIHFPALIYFGISFELLTGPVLYLYVRSLTDPHFRFKKADLLHGLPFLVHFGFFLFSYHLLAPDVQRALLRADAVFTMNEKLASIFVNHIHFLVYTVATILVIVRYRTRLNLANALGKGVNLNWLIFIAGGFLTNWSFHFLNSFLWTTVPGHPVLQVMDYRPLLIGSAFLFACMLVYQTLHHPERLYERAASPASDLPLSAAETQHLVTRIIRHMAGEKPFLDPAFDLQMLADGVGEKAYLVSRVLNQHLQLNFHTFVNGYRVKEVQRMLASPAFMDRNITEIMYEAGFNTKSVFNTVFKKETGMTPKAYRKSVLRPAGKHA